MGKRQRGISAEELAAQLEADPDFVARREAAEAARAARREQLQRASQPILDDLRRVGVEVEAIWRLYEQPESYDIAVPVLLQHLRKNYSEDTMGSIGLGLPSKGAAKWWDELKDIYWTTPSEQARDRIAATLSGCATRKHYNDLLTFVGEKRLGESRIYFLRPIHRIGNRAEPGAGRAVIETLSSDPVLGVEATAILQGKSRSQ